MAVTFRKVIGRPGVVLPKNPLGKRKVKIVDKDYWKEVCKEANALLKDGNLIPAPLGHTDDNGVYPVPLVKGLNDSLLDAKTGEPSRWDHAVNVGFWGTEKPFEVDEKTGELVGYLTAEGDPNDPNSQAGQVKSAYKQTSPFIADWVDGEGKTRRNALLHVCLTNRAVQPNQKPFELLTPSTKQSELDTALEKQGLTAPELAVAMALDEEDYTTGTMLKAKPKKVAAQNPTVTGGSAAGSSSGTAKYGTSGASGDMEVGEGSGDGSDAGAGEEGEGYEGDPSAISQLQPQVINQITALFSQKFQIEFPQGTTPQNFADRLLTVLTSIPDEDSEEEDELENMTVKPKDGQTSQSPTLMSQDNPDDIVIAKKSLESLTGLTASVLKLGYKNRVNAAVASGKIGKKRAANLESRIEGLALSLDGIDLDENGVLQNSIELDLQDIEGEVGLLDPPGQEAGSRPKGTHIPGDTDDMGNNSEQELSDEDVTKVLDKVIPNRRWKTHSV